jgi:hypothetical protein
MNRTRLSSIDILGITLGVIAILVVVGSVVTIARGRMCDAKWALGPGGAPWGGGDFSFGPPGRAEADEQVPAGATEIEVRNVAGAIELSGNPGASAISVHSVKIAPFKAALDRVRVDIRKEGNRLIIAEKHDGGIMARTGTVSFTIVVPKAITMISAHSVSGSVTVRGMESGIDQDLSTVSGGISADGARNLNASTTSGSIRFSSSGSALNVRSVSGSIDGTIQSLGTGGSAHLDSVSGSVTLDAFSGLDAIVSLHSLSGRVSCGFPLIVSEQKNNRLSGTIGRGSANVDVGTLSGSISLSKM